MSHEFDYQMSAETPAPNSYKPKTTQVTAGTPAFTLKSRSTVKETNDVPGPNAYQPGTAFRDSHPANISLSGRTALGKPSDTPGPQAYDPGIITKRAPQYTLEGRRVFRDENGVPGPGSYTTKSKSVMPRISLSSRAPARKPDILPGPGTYSKDCSAPRNDARKITMSGWNYKKVENVNPGPGAYNVENTGISKKGISLSFRTRTEPPNSVPGPGSYKPQTQFRRMPQYTLKSRHPVSAIEVHPGPGAYESKNTMNHSEIAISGRVEMGKPDVTPAPNEYNIPSPKAKIAHMIAPRNPEPASRPAPGPNSYTIKNQSSKPAFSLVSRYHDPVVKPEESPGVGAYSIETATIGGPKFTMSGRYAQKTDSVVPGPGAYEVAKSTLKASGGAALSGRYKRGWRVE